MHITGFEVLIHCREAAIHPGFITVFIHQVSPVLNRWSSPGISGIIIVIGSACANACACECVCMEICIGCTLFVLTLLFFFCFRLKNCNDVNSTS